ncbi:MAG: hypothetical protein KI785_08780 [Devosiaceae bacterium]|nr:hypothetical protein [Devosiaceae bacterium MH13]
MPKFFITPAGKRLVTSTALAALALGMASTGVAQDAGLTPTFGSEDLGAGFGSLSITIQAGGDIDATNFGAQCNGFIAEAPDFTLTYPGGADLAIGASSNEDTTIVVQAPDGQLYCNDDFDGFDPQVTISGQVSGAFAVWVGTFEPIQNNTDPDADIYIGEASGTIPVDPNGTPPPVDAGGFSVAGTPTFGTIDLPAGLAEPQVLELQAGGPVDAFAVNSNCAGFVAEVPDYVLNHSGGTLRFDVASDADTTLVIVGPDGVTSCNDDDVDLNPGLTIGNAPAGAYAVFVGTFAAIENDFYPNATLTVSSDGGAAPINPFAVPPRAQLEPAFGSVNLAAGFGSHSIEIQAGGETDAFELDGSCNGFIAEAPDYVVNLTSDADLRITARSDEDTTMTVITPDGAILCNDDFTDLNPGLMIPGARSGPYAIWVGTFAADGGFPATTLTIEEAAAKAQPPGAITRTALTAGFEPDPFTTVLAAGGTVEASTFDLSCVGSVANAPDFTLDYTNGDFPLRFYVTADADTTIVVRAPDGSVLCNDDFDGLNPSVALAAPASGSYEVYIGTFSADGSTPNATLAITEIVDTKELPPGATTRVDVASGLARQDFELLAGGSFDAYTVLEESCGGYVAVQPDFITNVTQGGLDIEMTVRSAEDTTLAIRTPSGTYVCDDDSGGDFNPLVTLNGAEAGEYQVWLGTFSYVGNAPATLSVRDINAPSTTPPNVPGAGKK